MTTCVSTISGKPDIVETFLPSPPDFYGDPIFSVIRSPPDARIRKSSLQAPGLAEGSPAHPQNKKDSLKLSFLCRGDWIRTSDLQLPKLAR